MEEKVGHLGTVELAGHTYYLDVLGMAVLGDETQILVRDIGIIKSVVFAHDGGKSFDWINPPKPKHKKKIEERIRQLLQARP